MCWLSLVHDGVCARSCCFVGLQLLSRFCLSAAHSGRIVGCCSNLACMLHAMHACVWQMPCIAQSFLEQRTGCVDVDISRCPDLPSQGGTGFAAQQQLICGKTLGTFTSEGARCIVAQKRFSKCNAAMGFAVWCLSCEHGQCRTLGQLAGTVFVC